MSRTVLEVNHLTKQYGKTKVIDDVSFKIKEGAIVGLVGPNGAGKTTIMKMLGGLALPTSGEISIFGDTSEKKLVEARSRMSFIIEIPYMDGDMSAYDNLERQRLQKGIPNKERVDEVLKIVGLSEVGKKATKKFSLGMKQRVGIACALLSKPEILVLDEPINGLDPEGIIQIRELLMDLSKKEHMTVLISSHILSELSLICTDYLFINKGKLENSLSSNELNDLCRQNYLIHTENNALAMTTLQEKLGIKECMIDEEGKIKLFERLDDIKSVSTCLFEAGIVPLELTPVKADLEQFYMDMMQEVDYVESDKVD